MHQEPGAATLREIEVALPPEADPAVMSAEPTRGIRFREEDQVRPQIIELKVLSADRAGARQAPIGTLSYLRFAFAFQRHARELGGVRLRS